METRMLGKTGIAVSRVGLGTSTPSRLGLEQGHGASHAVGIIQAAYEQGVNFIDTAPAYDTERIVGHAAKIIGRSQLVIATKTLRGLAIRSGWDTLVQRTQTNLEKSLKRLGTDYIDLFQLHHVTPGIFARAADMLLPMLVKAKEAGKIRAFGITEAQDKDPDHLMFLHARAPLIESFDTVMYAYGPSEQDKIIALAMNILELGTIAMRVNRGDGYGHAFEDMRNDVVLIGTGNHDHLKANIGEYNYRTF